MSIKLLKRRYLLRQLMATGASAPLLTHFLKPTTSIANTVIGRKHLLIQLHGAPNHYSYDVFLNPLNQSNFVANKSVATQYLSETINGTEYYTSAVYQTVEKMGLHVPPIWDEAVPKAGGGTRPMADLMKHMLQIRGVHVGNAAHPGAAELIFVPLGANISTVALATLNVKKPFSALAVSPTKYQFKSPEPKVPLVLSSNQNYIEEITAPFTGIGDAGLKSLVESLSSELEYLQSASEKTLLKSNQSLESAVLAIDLSKELKDRSFPDPTAEWNRLVDKYKDLVTRVFERFKPGAINPIPGISDKPVGHPTFRDQTYSITQTIKLYTPDLREMFVPKAGANQRVDRLAEHFALAEFTFLNDLSNSVTIAPRNLSDLKMRISDFTSAEVNRGVGFDEHFLGIMPSLMVNTALYMALSACMLELIEQLKTSGLWNDTVIQVCSEFNRSARLDGSGSDHGADAGSAAFYSGRIQSPMCLGDTLADSGNMVRGGTWGEGAQNNIAGGNFNVVNIASSLSTLLGVASPYTAGISLVQEVGGEIVPLPGISTGKTV